MPIKNRLSELHSEIVGWRRDIHRHPELRFEEQRTAALVAEQLRRFGCDEVVTEVGLTGVDGVIRGNQNTTGMTIGFRADMDALSLRIPQIETTTVFIGSTFRETIDCMATTT